MPTDWAGVVRPTRTFHDKLTLKIGGEDFVLIAANGETAGQLWVSVPGRRVVCSADYFQGGFLPNTGNGKRRQRYPITWARALREMAALKPSRVLTGHGDVLDDEAQIQRRLPAQAAMLESITAQVVAGLNGGQRRDLILDQVKLPEDLAALDDARQYYDKPRDIAAMAVKQLNGWWDDVPSHYAPAPLAAQAREMAALAGGPGKLIARALQLSSSDVALACNLADWAWLAAPTNKAVLDGATAVYRARVASLLPTQDALVYAEHLVNLRLQSGRAARA
jgi:alkyl sulfatase BDS1-like metallo-beta-lactamase superfamily hydrolase